MSKSLLTEHTLSYEDVEFTKTYNNRVRYYEENILSNRRKSSLKIISLLFLSVLSILITFYLILLTINVTLWLAVLVVELMSIGLLGIRIIINSRTLKHDTNIPNSDKILLRFKEYLMVADHEELEVNVYKVENDDLKHHSEPIYSENITPSQMKDLKEETSLVIEQHQTHNRLGLVSNFINKAIRAEH